MKTDVHQHLWTEPLVRALERRHEFPFVRHEHGLTVLFLAGERPYVIDLASEAPQRRAGLPPVPRVGPAARGRPLRGQRVGHHQNVLVLFRRGSRPAPR